MSDLLGVTVGVVGVLVLVLSTAAERYHSRRFAEHTERLATYAKDGQSDSLDAEIRRFHANQTLTLAVDVMAFGYPFGTAAVVAGGVLLAI